MALCGLTCFSEHTRKRGWSTLTFMRAPREQKLPGILSVAEVRTICERKGPLRMACCAHRDTTWPNQRMVHERRRTRPGSTMANFPGNCAMRVFWTKKLSSNCVIEVAVAVGGIMRTTMPA